MREQYLLFEPYLNVVSEYSMVVNRFELSKIKSRHADQMHRVNDKVDILVNAIAALNTEISTLKKSPRAGNEAKVRELETQRTVLDNMIALQND